VIVLQGVCVYIERRLEQMFVNFFIFTSVCKGSGANICENSVSFIM
jgi:hypothetical protein